MNKLRSLTSLALTLLAASAWADDSAFTFSGFGTIGATETNNGDAQFRSSPRESQGADKSVNWGIDSELGLQATYKPISQLTATVQVLSQESRNDSFRPEVEWANVKYDVTPEFAIRGGRIGAPIFLVSDFRNVGYANPWVRPPVEVYGQVPISHLNGADILWHHAFGDDTLTVQPYFGRGTFELSNNTDGKTTDTAGLNITYEMGSWTLRGGYVATKLTATSPSINTLLGGLQQTAVVAGAFSPALSGSLNQLASDLAVNDKHASFAGLGAAYDDGKYLMQAEYTQRRTDSMIADTNAWYATLGYHFGAFTPYATYATTSTRNRNQQNAVPTVGLPAAVAPYFVALNAGVASATEGYDEHDISAGLRWNVYKNIDIKAQVDHVQTEAGKGNYFVNPTPTFAGESVNVYSLTADFIF